MSVVPRGWWWAILCYTDLLAADTLCILLLASALLPLHASTILHNLHVFFTDFVLAACVPLALHSILHHESNFSVKLTVRGDNVHVSTLRALDHEYRMVPGKSSLLLPTYIVYIGSLESLRLILAYEIGTSPRAASSYCYCINCIGFQFRFRECTDRDCPSA